MPDVDALIADVRRTLGNAYALHYLSSAGNLVPADFLASCLDDRTLTSPSREAIRRYNAIADAFWATLGVSPVGC